MQKQGIDRAALFAALPDEWPTSLVPEIRTHLAAQQRKVVVLDDDPTGTQTVYGVPVLTTWTVERLRDELAAPGPAFYILTNSRSLPAAAAAARNAEIGRHLVAAAREAKRAFVVVSRSDSTLRGHFPGEVDALATALEQPFDGWLVIPFFEEGGRYTLDDVHYVAQGDRLIPAGETEFARDASFGYRASNLRAWIAEKTEGRIPADAVATITLDDLRRGGPDRVAARLLALPRGAMCIVNAASRRDLEVLTAGLLRVEEQGRRFLYRTAASFVAVRAGLTPRALLTADELDLPRTGGGLIMVGSYVPTTTAQVAALRSDPGLTCLEVSVADLLAVDRRDAAIAHIATAADRALEAGQDVLIFTSRDLVTGGEAEASLAIGRSVSEGLVAIARALTIRPRYLIAKGGITSSDLATHGLDVQRAVVLGQLVPGVPVWQLGPESRYPGLVYVVFPGNVGHAQSLVEARVALARRA